MKHDMQHLYFSSEESLNDFLQQHTLLTSQNFIVLNNEQQLIHHSISCDFQIYMNTLIEQLSYKKNMLTLDHIYACHYNTYLIEVKKKAWGILYQLDFTNTQPNTDDLMLSFHSRSTAMKSMMTVIEKVAKTPFPVLVRGESGSGKEWVAQAIHQYSLRKHQPFIAVNCAALNTNLLESELFGHVKGAFTGAIRDHKGMFERAVGGTLFLDEIAEIPLELQAKLLRVLETGEFTPLGGEKAIQSDVRIITATHKALREEAKLGRFRQDLLYRLRVIPIFIPALRERKEDLPLLVPALLAEHAIGQPLKVSDEVMQILECHDWSGNIRELKNTLLYAITMAQGKTQIEQNDLPRELLIENNQEPEQHPMSKERFDALMQQHHQNLNVVAKILNVSRSTLWRYRQKWEAQ